MPTQDPDRYLAVLKASYDYAPQSDDEIEIKENQILLLVERTDDDWWKVKVKGETQDTDTPVGLVPAAYVEQAEHSHLVKALYDYKAAGPGELTISEDDVLLAFEADDDWLLVQDQKEDGGGAGYVPGNYVEEATEDKPASTPKIIVPPSNPRPVSVYVDPADLVAASKVTADDIKTWSVSEVDKKGKKKKGTLGVGNGSVFFASESDKTPVQKWKTSDIIDISHEKSKHVGIEIGGATPINLLFNVGSKDNVEEITNKLEASRAIAKPANTDASPPRKTPEKGTVRFSPAEPTIIPTREDEGEDGEDGEEVDQAEQRDHSTSNGHTVAPKAGGESAVALYGFTADGDDELTVVEGEALVVLERDGDEWWKCRNTHGAEGVVPASYLELKAGTTTPSTRAAPPKVEEEPADNGEAEAEAEAARAAQEAADRAEAERLQREERERAAKERKRLEAQRRAKEAAAATAAAMKKSPPPQSNRNESKGTTSPPRKSQEVTFPPADDVRTWHDRSGQFRVDAAFLGFNGGKLRLHKINGVIVEVPAEKMSVDDIKYVERLTRKLSRGSQNGHGHTTRQSQSQSVSEEDIPIGMLPKPNSASKSQLPPASNPTHKRKGPVIDWFDFFLSAGCDMDDCTRYAAAFERDKIDESILADITDSTMRSLGLREGDIIRVQKAIEKRKPGENLEKPSPYIQEQIRKDEQLARQLQGKDRTPAPNLFTGGPGGALRRGRKETTKTLPTNVDRDALSSASEQIQRTTSPQAASPTTRAGSAPAQPAQQAKVNSSATAQSASGFEDDAWAPRPGSAKPAVATSPPSAAPTAPAAAAPTPPAQPASAPPVTAIPAAAPAKAPTPPAPVPTVGSPAKGLAQTTQSDVFDQLARLSQLRQTTPQPLMQQQPVQASTTTTTFIAPPGFSTGLGLGATPIPMGQALNAQQAGLLQPSSQPQQQQYNGPRGPFAPVPANQSLLQPLIPTQTGFNSFVPTRSMSNPSPSFQNQMSQPSFMPPQPTGMMNPGVQPQMMMQPTGMPGLGFSSSPFGSGSMMNASPFGSGSTFQPNNGGFNPSPVTIQPTGVFAHSPFNAPASPPPVPPLPSGNSNINSTAPVNVFASMKSGTFAQDENHNVPQSTDKYNALRPNVAPQPTGWGYGGYSGF